MEGVVKQGDAKAMTECIVSIHILFSSHWSPETVTSSETKWALK